MIIMIIAAVTVTEQDVLSQGTGCKTAGDFVLLIGLEAKSLGTIWLCLGYCPGPLLLCFQHHYRSRAIALCTAGKRK